MACRQAIESFVKNKTSGILQLKTIPLLTTFKGELFFYVNNDKTPWANSDYRLLNRTPSNQDGSKWYRKILGGYEFLLANDVDNSNPVVQAEQLNQIHYLVNWGSIVMGDKDANFDGIRVLMQLTMSMLTFSKFIQTTSERPLVWINLKPMHSLTFLSLKLGI